MMLIADAIALHRAAVVPRLGPAIGAAERDVASLEERLGCRLPRAYREFLLWMGEDRKGVLQGSDCFLGNVESNEHDLIDLLSENGVPALAYRPIVFFLQQGYLACWFHSEDPSADPEVFSFNEAIGGEGIRSLGRFTQWLHAELSQLAGHLQDIRGSC